jgi:hypothetical protein
MDFPTIKHFSPLPRVFHAKGIISSFPGQEILYFEEKDGLSHQKLGGL